MSELPPTAPAPVQGPRLRRARAIRRVVLSFLAAFVLLGALGVFGVRTNTASATGGGYELTLSYPWTERSNQPIHWVLEIRHPGGFPGKINLAIEHSYFDLLELNDVEPAPDSTTTRGRFVVWTFEPPPGDLLRVSIDALIQPNSHFGAGAELAILEGGNPVVSLHYRTWVAP